jgi:hypothetical protein
MAKQEKKETLIEQYQSTKSVTLNQQVESRRLVALDKAYTKLKEYAEAKGLKKPLKGTFLSDVLKEGLEVVTPEVFFNTPRG